MEQTRVGSWEISKMFNVEHRVLRKAIKNSMSYLMELDIVISPRDELKRRSRPIQEFLLNTSQWRCVCRFLRETPKNRHVKDYFMQFFDKESRPV